MPAETPPLIPDALRDLQADPQQGLAPAVAAQRQQAQGFNEVPEGAASPLRAFALKFWGPSAWMLEAVAALSLALGKLPDLAVACGLLLLNAVLASVQEHRAAGVLKALRQRLAVSARVKRGGSWQVVPGRELVAGDIVRLRAGDIAPADALLLEGALSADQSALTGESQAVELAVGGLMLSGAVAQRGEAKCLVLRTGARTVAGRTLTLVQQAAPKFHLDAVMAKVVRWLFLIVGSLLAVVLLLALMRGTPLLGLLPLLLILLTSAVPMALPVMFTVSMALGSKELARRGVLVTRLSAIEDAATMDVLCVDKTGTLTLNQLALTGTQPRPPASEDDLVWAGALASKRANQDPIDLAFLAQADARGLFASRPHAVELKFTPFDAATRCTEAVLQQGDQRVRVMKGALEAVAEACRLDAATVDGLKAQAHEQALRGARTLALAQGPEAGPLTLLGLVTLQDPLRPDAQPLIKALQGLGIGVKMLTGDALEVAQEIGRSLGLPQIRRMAELRSLNGPDAQAAGDFLAGVDGLAEVYPQDKFNVVEHLQAVGHSTGMSGDGVNDAPALRQAEVGIAVSSASDVAKRAASVVLTEPGLVNIVALVEQGRTIYQRIVTYVLNKVSRTILKTAYVALAFVVTGSFVLSAFAMLLLIFITDFAKVSLATDHVRSSPKPETWDLRRLMGAAGLQGALMSVETLGGLAYGWRRFGLADDPAALCSFSFLILLYFAAFSILSARERSWCWSTRPSSTVLQAVAAELLLGSLAPHVGLPGLAPLPWLLQAGLAAYALAACLGVNDAVKVLAARWLAAAP